MNDGVVSKTAHVKFAFDPLDWQPFTFRGVARLAVAPPRRWFKVQWLAMSWVVVSVIWFLATAWWPVINGALDALPNQAFIQGRALHWDGPLPARLGENAFLGITVAQDEPRNATSDLEIRLAREEARLYSLFGHVAVRYPQGYIIVLNRMEFQAWWEAWRWPILAATAIVAYLLLWILWSLLALLYAVWVGLFSLYADREAAPSVCWRLAAAAQTPSVVLIGVTIFLYGLHHLSLVGLLFAFLVQLVVGWIYLLIAPYWLPRHSKTSARNRNPFRR